MRHWSRRRGLFCKSETRRLPDLGTSILLFAAGCASWIIGIFSGGGGSIVLLAVITHLIRVKTIAPVITIASLMAGPTRILVSWRLIEWAVVCWYLPGATTGAIVGSWFFTWANAAWLHLIVGLFLVSMPIQYRLGAQARSFPMRLPWFIPVSVAVGVISGVIGAVIANFEKRIDRQILGDPRISFYPKHCEKQRGGNTLFSEPAIRTPDFVRLATVSPRYKNQAR